MRIFLDSQKYPFIDIPVYGDMKKAINEINKIRSNETSLGSFISDIKGYKVDLGNSIDERIEILETLLVSLDSVQGVRSSQDAEDFKEAVQSAIESSEESLAFPGNDFSLKFEKWAPESASVRALKDDSEEYRKNNLSVNNDATYEFSTVGEYFQARMVLVRDWATALVTFYTELKGRL